MSQEQEHVETRPWNSISDKEIENEWMYIQGRSDVYHELGRLHSVPVMFARHIEKILKGANGG